MEMVGWNHQLVLIRWVGYMYVLLRVQALSMSTISCMWLSWFYNFTLLHFDAMILYQIGYESVSPEGREQSLA